VGAFNNLIYKGIPDKFPDLRWCFVETTSQWVPYALNDLLIRTQAELAFRRKHADSPFAGVRGAPRDLTEQNLLRDNRIYVACQTTDDLPYVLEHAGEDNIIVGTDYGHADYSNDMEAITKLSQNGVLAAGVADKILSDNPRRLYSL
jgi:predicted TIM-barrel fold metal-dependent hydrolase